MKIRALIVDDEPLARERIRRMLGDEPDIEIVGECVGGVEGVTAIEESKPDLVFLDVQMPEMNGFEVLQTIYSVQTPVIIFVTAYDQYAIKAFEFHALDYLLKPFNIERLQSAVKRAREQIKAARLGNLGERLVTFLADLKKEKKYLERLILKSSGRVYFVRTEEIEWIEGAGNYVKLYVGKEAHLLRETMNRVEHKLKPDQFLRIHRSYIVNINFIKELHPLFSGDYTVILRDKTELTLSRNYRDRFLEAFEK